MQAPVRVAKVALEPVAQPLGQGGLVIRAPRHEVIVHDVADLFQQLFVLGFVRGKLVVPGPRASRFPRERSGRRSRHEVRRETRRYRLDSANRA